MRVQGSACQRSGFMQPKVSSTLTVLSVLAMQAGSHYGATFYQHAAFARAVRGEGSVEVTADDGLRAVAMGTAAEISAREKRVVEMAEFGL